MSDYKGLIDKEKAESNNQDLLHKAEEKNSKMMDKQPDVNQLKMIPQLESDRKEESDTSNNKPDQNQLVEADNKVVSENLQLPHANCLDQIIPFIGSSFFYPKRQPKFMEAFLGTMFEIRTSMEKQLEKIESVYQDMKDEDRFLLYRKSDLERLDLQRESLIESLNTYQWTTRHIWIYQWSLVALVMLMTLFQAVAVVIYVKWHGVNLISYDFYSSAQIAQLSMISFVNGSTTMSVIAEILIWSSLGVWASYSYQYGKLMLKRKFRFADHGPMYIAHLVRNTSVVSAVILLLRLSQFSIFGITIADDNTQLGFDSTIGLAFLLGFFGDDATHLLLKFKDTILGNVKKSHEQAELV